VVPGTGGDGSGVFGVSAVGLAATSPTWSLNSFVPGVTFSPSLTRNSAIIPAAGALTGIVV
jgi:hypothetical protein